MPGLLGMVKSMRLEPVDKSIVGLVSGRTSITVVVTSLRRFKYAWYLAGTDASEPLVPATDMVAHSSAIETPFIIAAVLVPAGRRTTLGETRTRIGHKLPRSVHPEAAEEEEKEEGEEHHSARPARPQPSSLVERS